jgi:hypothetical protein
MPRNITTTAETMETVPMGDVQDTKDLEQTRYALGSQDWCEVLFDELRSRLARIDLTGLDWSQGETFINPPPDLSAGAKQIGWHLIVRQGEAAYHAVPGEGLDYLLIVDYERIVPIDRTVHTADPQAALALRQQKLDDGTLQVVGDRDKMPAAIAQALDGLHDAIIARTQ